MQGDLTFRRPDTQQVRKESAQTVNLIIACASNIVLSNVQFFLKVVDANTISREFPGMEGMEVKYHRCQI